MKDELTYTITNRKECEGWVYPTLAVGRNHDSIALFTDIRQAFIIRGEAGTGYWDGERTTCVNPADWQPITGEITITLNQSEK
jgi:hypothetical protein